MRRLITLAALALSACGGQEQASGWLCTVPIDIKAGDYTVDYMGEWLYMPDLGTSVRVLYPCEDMP